MAKKAILLSFLLSVSATTGKRPMTPEITYAEAEQKRDSWQFKEPMAQDETNNSTSNRFFRYSASNIPHIEKKDRGGEDAFYASDSLLAVADGVGGWANRGIDAGRYSKSLVWYISQKYKENNAQELKNILVDSVVANYEIGSTTCVIAKFDTSREDYIKTTNLGDSGYVIYRPLHEDQNELQQTFRSQEQQYQFNFPFQCGVGHPLPYKAFDNSHQIQDNDIIVMASDGVFDNLYDNQIEECLLPSLKGFDMFDLKAASDCIARQALMYGYSRTIFSPFAEHAKQHQKRYEGGKDDDIVAIVAQIHTRNKGKYTVPTEVQTNAMESKVKSSKEKKEEKEEQEDKEEDL